MLQIFPLRTEKKIKLIPVVLFLIWILLFLSGNYFYLGARLFYLMFSLCYLCLIGSVFFYRVSYSYLYLATFIWLGFWLKFTTHTIFHYSYEEATGGFVQTGAAWDQLLIIATVGCLGILFARVVYSFLACWPTILCRRDGYQIIPSWYRKYRIFLLLLLVSAFIFVAIYNVIYGVQQSGLVPRTILHWPLNAVLYWMQASGFSLVITLLLGWEVGLSKSAFSLFIISLFEAFFSAVSTLSRGLYIFHVIPYMVSIFFNKDVIKKISKLRLFLTMILCGTLFILSLQGVTILRSYYYSGVLPELHKANDQLSVSAQVISRLFVERWIGVEGLMAVSSYPVKSMDLFYEALTEKSEIGKVVMYQKVANSQYQHIDSQRFTFATLPGPVAFLYYSGSLVFVFFGMFIFTILMMLSENLVVFLTRNVFTGSLYGMTIANSIAQIGLTPIVLVKFYLMIFVFIFLLWLVQTISAWNIRGPHQLNMPQDCSI